MAQTNAETTKVQISRINELSQLARTAWFTLMGYLVFVGITLLGVEDADFFFPARQTQLPLVNVSIPTSSFFWTAPVLAALYTYLHVFLLKLWDAIGAAKSEVRTDPERRGWIPLADAIHPWLVNDLACWLKGNGAIAVRPLNLPAALVTVLLVWAAGPLVIGYAWLRSMPAHNGGLTVTLGACLFVAVVVGAVSAYGAVSNLTQADLGRPIRSAIIISTSAFAIILIAVSFLRTEVNVVISRDTPILGRWIGSEERMSLARIDLSGRRLGNFPANWQGCHQAKEEFRWKFAQNHGLNLNEDWPDEKERSFEVAWWRNRSDFIDRIPTLDISRADLRNADLSNSVGIRVNFPELPWHGATITKASLFEGSRKYYDDGKRSIKINFLDFNIMNLNFENMSGADLSGISQYMKDFRETTLDRVNFSEAALYLADFSGAILNETNFRFSELQSSDMSFARVSYTNLHSAQLLGANLTGLDIQNSDLSDASLRGAVLNDSTFRQVDLTGTNLAGILVRGADLRGATGLTQDQLDRAVGDENTLLPERTDPTHEGLRVVSCWTDETKPTDDELQRIVEIVARERARGANQGTADRSEFLCAGSRPTGTPCPSNFTREQCLDPEQNPDGFHRNRSRTGAQ